ncbi:shikimate kinase [Stutzerimonas stutzeri]|nr:shikimate kinase [Stutzerimonas stutzeri]
MGVSGSGKTTIGEQLAARLGCGFSDADESRTCQQGENGRRNPAHR